MIDLGPHGVFIIWAYAGVALGVAGLIGWTLYQGRVTERKLAALQARQAPK